MISTGRVQKKSKRRLSTDFFAHSTEAVDKLKKIRPPGKSKIFKEMGGLVMPPAARSFLSAREKIGEKRAPWGTGVYRIAF
jgi:hypothetical protein